MPAFIDDVVGNSSALGLYFLMVGFLLYFLDQYVMPKLNRLARKLVVQEEDENPEAEENNKSKGDWLRIGGAFSIFIFITLFTSIYFSVLAVITLLFL